MTSDARIRLPGAVTWSGLVVLVLLQAGFALQGLGGFWQWGHNGYNGAAYQQAARNTLRWGDLLPAQYVTGPRAPRPDELYTHAPLALHLHTTASVALLGDRPEAVRLVPAVHGIVAVLLLFGVARRRWGDLVALVATSLYVLMPINHAFANMSNHATGSFVWGLLGLGCYLEWARARPPDEGGGGGDAWRWGVAAVAALLMALQWDWTAYYVVFVVALHGLGLAWARPEERRRHVVWVGALSVVTLISFFGFFALVYATVGSFAEIQESVSKRARPPARVWSRLWGGTLRPMFSAPLLLLGLVWCGWRVERSRRGEPLGGDLIVVAWGVAGVAHTLLFRNTAIVHVYWPWPLTIAVALAAATLVVAAARVVVERAAGRGGELGRAVVAVAMVGGLVAGVALWSVPLMWEGRRVAGTFDKAEGYDPQFEAILFAREVAKAAGPEVRVMMHPEFKPRIEFFATLDRRWETASSAGSLVYRGEQEAVLVADLREVPPGWLRILAARRPVEVWGDYAMIDLRRRGGGVRAWRWVREEPGVAWRFWHSVHEAPVRAVRDEARERALRRRR